MSELNKIAVQILSKGKGILAADESTGTMTKRLDGVNVPSTPENRLLFRETLFSASGMAECIGGVILYDETIKQQTSKKNLIPELILKMEYLDNEKGLHNSLNSMFENQYQIIKIESIGPKIGKELKSNSLKAIAVALLLIGIYITFRFDSYYAFGSIVALFHDIAITFSFLIFLQYEISISIIAALLTILGYSLNDTIVIYDRIRENMSLNIEKLDRNIVANKSLNTTLNRTVITSLTTLLVAVVLFILGGPILQPFAMALIIGVLTGTYSSLFIATPIMLILEEKYKLEDFEEE